MINKLLRKLPHNQWNQRYGVWTLMVLAAPDGTVYLRRRRIVQTPLFAVYVHDILTPDVDLAPHSHPFPFVSVVLRGAYVEQVYYPREGDTHLGPVQFGVHRKGSIHSFPRGNGQVHRISTIANNCRTLVFAGRRRDSWGFFEDGVGMVPWREHVEAQQGGAIKRVANDE